VQEILVPDGQFKEDQPNLASLCIVAQQINYDYDSQSRLQTLLTYLCDKHFPEHLATKEYKHVYSALRLLKLLTINITSITLFEILVTH